MSRLRQSVQLLLHVQDAPHRTALAFGIGIFIAFFPILGIHTALALAIAFRFRLSRVAILLGAYVNNPWTVAPMFMAGTLLGCLILGIPPEGLWGLHWNLEGWAFYRDLLHTLRPFLWPYLIGNCILGVVTAATAYAALRVWLERRAEKPS